MVSAMSTTAGLSPTARRAAQGQRVVCAEQPVTGAFRIGVLVVCVCLAAVVPTILDNFPSTMGHVSTVKWVGYGLAALGALWAVTMRGREIAVERGDVIVRHLTAPLRPESERRIPGPSIRDVTARATLASDDIMGSRRRHVVTAHLNGTPARVRLLTTSDDSRAAAAVGQIKDALHATGMLGRGIAPR